MAAKSEEKRNQILKAAQVAFLKSGFDGTSMDEISHMAGVSKGTLYVYFRNKEDLFATFLAFIQENVFQETYADLNPDADFKLNLERLACSYLDLVLTPDNLALFRVVVSGSTKFPHLGKLFFEAGMQTIVGRLQDILQRHAINSGSRIEDAALASAHFFGSLYASAVFPTAIGQMPAPLDAERARTARYAVNTLLTHIEKH